MPTDVVEVGATGIRFVVEGSESNGSAAMFGTFIPANVKLPALHSHDGYEERIYGLEGTATFVVEGQLAPSRRV
jgi:quercetin dioxygenase-like cupin family protein